MLGVVLPMIVSIRPVEYALKKQRVPMLVNFVPATVKFPLNCACPAKELDPTVLNVLDMVNVPLNAPTWPPTLNAGWFELNAPYTRLGCPTICSI